MASNSLSQSRKRASPSLDEHTPSNGGIGRRMRGDSFVLLSWHELQSWQQDNEFMLTGYRPASESFHCSLQSLKHIHNESVNIYSHLFGAVLFVILPFYTYSTVYPRYATAHLGDIVVFSTFFFGVAICFFISACFHIIANHSATVAAHGIQLDYIGVVILMWGATIPSVYYGFYCDPKLQGIYWIAVTLLACTCILTTLHPNFNQSKFRHYRVAMYSGLGLSAIVFIIHGIILHGWELQNRTMSLWWMALMGALNLAGAAAYAARVPERWFPRKHDIFGCSHQIMHFMVIFAGLSHMIGLLKAFDYIHGNFSICR